MGRLFSFVVTLVVVGTCLVVATRIAIGQEPEVDKPATPVPQRVRGRDREADQEPEARSRHRAASAVEGDVLDDTEPDGGPLTDTVSHWRRVRSLVLLAVLLTALGIVVALVVAIFGAVVLNGLRSAVQ